jgi:glutamine synthetase
VKPKAVLAYCREKGIRSVDLRFVDINGDWRRITFPLAALTEAAFDEGFGHSIVLNPSSNQDPVHAILVPQSEANYLDPFTNQPALILIASVQDAVMRDESPLDSRQLAVRCMRYLESTSIGDGLSVRPRFQFRVRRDEVSHCGKDGNPNSFLACGFDDHDFELRCVVADAALESGLQIERHFSGADESSEMFLKPSSLVECCDDVMMLRYLIGQHAWRQGARVLLQNLWMPSKWSITRLGDPVLVGTAYRGLSDVGLHAIGGLLKHADAIAAVALSNDYPQDSFPWLRICSDDDSDSICRILVGSHDPRARAIEYLGAPASSNPYLVYSAVLMAMIDGIQNKVSPVAALDVRISGASDSLAWSIGVNGAMQLERKQLMDCLNNDRDFLSRGEVFSDELINLLCGRLGA